MLMNIRGGGTGNRARKVREVEGCTLCLYLSQLPLIKPSYSTCSSLGDILLHAGLKETI